MDEDDPCPRDEGGSSQDEVLMETTKLVTEMVRPLNEGASSQNEVLMETTKLVTETVRLEPGVSHSASATSTAEPPVSNGCCD